MVVQIKLVDLAYQLGATLYGDENTLITGIASIHNAKKGHITFFKNKSYRDALISCRASAVILSLNDLFFCHIPALVVVDPYLSYIKVAKLMDTTPKPKIKIASGAIIAPDAILGERISVGANVVIESGVILSNDIIIGPGSFIGENVKIGSKTQLHANVTIHHNVEIGKCCLIQSGTTIGSDGFGYFNNHGIWMKIPQLGSVKVGNYVEIGSCTTIDRGTLDNTCIENGVIIDNQCQIAHNVIIGENTAIAGGVIIAGSTKIGKYCMIGGASVINGHINICDKVTITGMGMVMRTITKSGTYSSGIPVQPNTIWRKTAVLVMHISKINRHVKTIEKKLKKLFISL